MNKLAFAFIMTLFFSGATAQQLNSWFDLFSLHRIFKIAFSDKQMFAAGKNSIMAVDQNSGQLDIISIFNGLSDHSIVDIDYNQLFKTLTIIYKTGNIDIIKNGKINNLPYILENQQFLDKTLNSVTSDRTYIYVAGSLGIIRIDPSNLIIVDVLEFPTDKKVKKLAFLNSRLWAVTDSGVFFTDPRINFLDFQLWKKINLNFAFDISANDNNIFVATFNGINTEVYKIVQDSVPIKVTSAWGKYNLFIDGQEIYLYGKSIIKYDTSGNYLANIPIPNVDRYYINYMTKYQDKFFLADYYNGVLVNFGENQILYDSPLSDDVRLVKYANDRLYLLYNPTVIDSLTGSTAFYSYKDLKTQQWKHIYLPIDARLYSLAVDPNDPDHLFIGTYGQGLIEVKQDHIVAVYNSSNSPLSGQNNQIVVTDLFFDQDRVLWILESQSDVPIIKFDQQTSQWEIEPLASPAANAPTENFFLSENGLLWAALDQNGILVIDYNLEQSKVFSPRIGKTVNYITSDLNNYIWIATSDGVGYIEATDIENINVVRPKVEITLNDTTIYAYLLDNVRVSGILIDPANRKWVSTTTAGIYFLSEDCLTQYGAFNRFNNLFPTNTVYQMTQDPKRGKIYFNTDIGVVGYYADASQANRNFNDIRIIPNPVHPNYDGPIIITGLMYRTIVKITDIEGNLVYETLSNGGMATWDGKTLSGRPVSSGVYLIFCIDEQNINKCVKKILIVR